MKDRKRFTHTAALTKIMEMDDIEIVHAHQIVTIGVADPETAELLKIGLGEPTADCRLVLVDSDNIAVYVANIHYHRSCFALRLDLIEEGKNAPRRRARDREEGSRSSRNIISHE